MWRSVDLCGWICPHLEMISDTAKFGHNTESVKHRFSLYILGLRRAFIVDYGAVVYFGILTILSVVHASLSSVLSGFCGTETCDPNCFLHAGASFPACSSVVYRVMTRTLNHRCLSDLVFASYSMGSTNRLPFALRPHRLALSYLWRLLAHMAVSNPIHPSKATHKHRLWQ